MILYIFVTVLACFFAYLSYKVKYTQKDSDSKITTPQSRILLVAAIVPLFLVSALRVNVGTDYPAYKAAFDSIAAGGTPVFEPGFNLLYSAILLFSNNAQWLFAISALITFYFIYKAISRDSANSALSIYLFCNLSFLYYSFNATRQFIAVSIILFALHYIIQRHFFKYVLSVFAAFLFHVSAIFMIPVYFLANLRYKRYQYVAIFTVALFALQIHERITNLIIYIYPQYDAAALTLYEASPSEIFILTNALFLLMSIILLKKNVISREDNSIRISINLAFFSFVMHTALFWIPLIDRASLYVDISLIIFIPIFIHKISSKNTRLKVIVFLIAFSTIYTFVSVALRGSHNALPYQSVFSYSLSGKSAVA
jgi:hypothetical protein